MQNYIASLFTFLFLTFGFISCTTEVCDDVVCANNGVCLEGACQCVIGFEGNRCETRSRDKFLGTYSVIEDGTMSLPVTYSVNIHANTTGEEDEIRIKGFNNYFDDECIAKCKGDSMTISLQTLAGGNQVQGYGIFTPSDYYGDHGTMVVYYKVISPNGSVNDYGYDTDPNHASDWSK